MITRRRASARVVCVLGLLIAAGCGDDAPGTTVATATSTADTTATPPDTETSTADVGAEPDADAGGPNGGFAYLVVEPARLDFGVHAVGATVTRDLELENAGDRALTLTSIRLVGGQEAFAKNLDQALVTPGAKKTIKVTFYALADGSFEDVLRFESNAVNGARLDVPVTGVVAQAVCQDADGDLHGVGCAAGADCNDSDPNVYVGATERHL